METQQRSADLRGARWLFPVISMLVLYLSAPSLFQDPRFWAEEGSVYYQKAVVSDWSFLFTFVAQGNYQFLANLFVYLSTFVDIKAAPVVTTYLAIATFGLVAMQLETIAKQYKIPFELSILSLLAFCLSPAMTEIFATSTNVQWVAALSVLLMTITSYSQARPSWRILIYIWIAACGLTGVPSVLLAPFFFLQAYLSKSRPHFIMGCILVLCVAIQALVILDHNHPDRQIVLSPTLLLAPFLLQTVFTQFSGANLTNALGALILENRIYLILIMIASGGLIGSCLYLSRDKQVRNAAVILTLVCVCVSIAQTAGAIGTLEDKINMLSAATGARYFATGILSLLILVSFAGRFNARPFVALGLIVIVANGAMFSSEIQKQRATNFPSWKDQVKACQFPCTVKIWPNTWTVVLQR
ncbi:hypothetical protein [Phyllobacterium myrsinacearum]|nr:hypothetical protein [Phyllobacterium myrsinacearum]